MFKRRVPQCLNDTDEFTLFVTFSYTIDAVVMLRIRVELLCNSVLIFLDD